MDQIKTLFQYPLMDYMKNRCIINVLVIFCYPQKTTVDLIATYNSEHFSVDTNYDEEDGLQNNN